MIGIAKLEKFVVTCAVLCLSACGADSGGSENNEANQAGVEENSALGAPNYALLVNGEAPECGDSNKDQLAYFTAEDAFMHCDGSSWVSIDVRGTDGADGQDGAAGITVEKQWGYEVTTYIGTDNLMPEGAGMAAVFVGNIELNGFSDDSRLLVVSGYTIYQATDSSSDLINIQSEFTVVSLIPPSDDTVVVQRKITSFADALFFVELEPIDLTDSSPIIRIGTSADGNEDNDAMFEFELSEL